MSNLKRNHYCGTLGKADNEKEVVLCGWVAKRRDHGGLIFIDLRDRSGIVQVVVDPDHAGNDFATAEAIRSEYVIKVHGVVRLRSDETVNPNLATGEVEVVAKELEVLNSAKTPPFYIQDGIAYNVAGQQLTKNTYYPLAGDKVRYQFTYELN